MEEVDVYHLQYDGNRSQEFGGLPACREVGESSASICFSIIGLIAFPTDLASDNADFSPAQLVCCRSWTE
jgi:hypothetical protein